MGAVAFAALPGWLLTVGGAERKPGDSAPPLGATIPEGERNEKMASLAGSLRRRGLEADEILACLSVVNENRCDPPLSEDELTRIARSIARRPAARPLVTRKAA
jgi:hypothetical protein